MIHPLAGTPAQETDIIDVKALEQAFYDRVPNYDEPHQRVSFGTSGHRGISFEGSFNELHVAAITQAICDLRKKFQAEGPCFIGEDTHALSGVAWKVVMEVLLANGVHPMVAHPEERYVPTPSISRAILRHNETAEAGSLGDGIILTPSHNPPEHGGIKYNPIHGGPADGAITKAIEEKANAYIQAKGEGIRREPLQDVLALAEAGRCTIYPFRDLYVKELSQVIDLVAIQAANKNILVDCLGGSGASYWKAINMEYNLNLTIIHTAADPTFKFMTYDHDGVIRMDCSSPYAMKPVVDNIDDYVLAVGNDPDYDRYGVVTCRGLMPANHFLSAAGAYLFSNRPLWKDKGFGKTAVVTDVVDRFCKEHNIPVYEVPVGFKYFAPLLYNGTVGIAGEESAGASFLKKDGTVWTTDKDGIIMALLAMEMMCVIGDTPEMYYKNLAAPYGAPSFSRIDVKATKEEKALLKAITPEAVTTTELCGEPIEEVRHTSLHESLPIDGVKVITKSGWFVARPSGTEDLYKIYAESFQGPDAVDALMEAGKELVSRSIQ